MKRIKIDCNQIKDWESFHGVFAEHFEFPDFYGRNMDAWIDCMSYLDDPDSGMTKNTCDRGEYIILELENIQNFQKKYPVNPRGRTTRSIEMEHIIANFGLKQAYIELFRDKNAVFTKEIWREQKDILFRGTSGIAQLNKVRKGLTG